VLGRPRHQLLGFEGGLSLPLGWGRFFLAPVPKQANNEKPPSSSKRALSFVDSAILRFLLFAFAKAFQDRRAPWYQGGLIRKPLRKIGVILLHDVEHRFLGEIAMVLRK